MLDMIFAWGAVEVHDAYSRPNTALRMFRNTAEVMAGLDKPSMMHFLLRVPSAVPRLLVESYQIQSGDNAGAVMQRAAIDGCISIQLRVPGDSPRFEYSTANTPSVAAYGHPSDGIVPNIPGGGSLDVGLTCKTSAALNRRIRKLAVGALNTVLVMPGAADLWIAGTALGQWDPAKLPKAFRWL
jgi:hypothetical protein